MDERRKKFTCPHCSKTGWLFREGDELVCCQCEHRFMSKRKDDMEKVPQRWEVD